MSHTTAGQMIPGMSYVGTNQGPDELAGRTFKVISRDEVMTLEDDGILIDVHSWKVRLNDAGVIQVWFSPGDIVIPLNATTGD